MGSFATEEKWLVYGCGFNNSLPIMHVIVYTLRGLLECALMDNDEIHDMNLIEVVLKTVNPLCEAANRPIR